MSIDLVNRSLHLDIVEVVKDKNVKECKISTARQGIKHEKRKLQKKRQKAIVEKNKGKKIKSALEKYKEEHFKDNTESNVEALLRITELGKVNNKVAEKILFQQPCQLSRDLKAIVQETKITVFTEEDFQKFEKEYKVK